MKRQALRNNKKIQGPYKSLRHSMGQATAELAIMGAIVLMVLGYLLQQGYIYNCRQALEMYAFRKALQLSQQENRGISLSVIRDVISPSFFTGLNRQRLMAFTSVEYNPWMLYIPWEEDPEDVSTRQLLQINEAMIRNGSFFQVPPTKMKITSKEQEEGGADVEWMWYGSNISEIDPQTQPVKVTQRKYQYNYNTSTTEDSQAKNISKDLQSMDEIPTAITFEDKQRIIDNYFKEDWEGKLDTVEVDAGTIPRYISLILNETVRRQKDVKTPK